MGGMWHLKSDGHLDFVGVGHVLCFLSYRDAPCINGIFTHIWLRFMVNVGKCSSPMEYLGYINGSFYGMIDGIVCCNITCAILRRRGKKMSKMMIMTFQVDEG